MFIEHNNNNATFSEAFINHCEQILLDVAFEYLIYNDP